ncbi:MAG: hypothetical protein GY829_06090 [Gammaproteobacteria bacterium]|nr:hypothetical protein [Gammaproteobacteria bacterium]
MTEQKRQNVAAIMDDEYASNAEIEALVSDPEMRSIWSRFHLVRDVIQGDVPEVINPQLNSRIFKAIQDEPALLVPSARREVMTWPKIIKGWSEQVTGFAIAASVTAMMVLGMQSLNTPEDIGIDNSAITSLELLNVDSSLIADETEYSVDQELLIEFTRQQSLYGLHDMSPLVSVVNYTVPIKLKPTSEHVYFNLDDEESSKPKK